MVRNGAKVQRVLHELSAGKGWNDGNAFVTVGQVAQNAGCSKPSALKYLKILEQHGICRSWQLDNRMWFWAWGK